MWAARLAPKEASHRTAGRAVAEPLRSDWAKGNELRCHQPQPHPRHPAAAILQRVPVRIELARSGHTLDVGASGPGALPRRPNRTWTPYPGPISDDSGRGMGCGVTASTGEILGISSPQRETRSEAS